MLSYPHCTLPRQSQLGVHRDGGWATRPLTGTNNTVDRVSIATSRDFEAVAIDVPRMAPGGAYALHHHGSGVGGKVQVLPAGRNVQVRVGAIATAWMLYAHELVP
jgi:hypothetical protein